MKHIILLLSVLIFSSSSFALTPTEEVQFQSRVDQMGRLKKTGVVVTSLAGMALYCAGGAAISTVALLADTVPGVAKIQAMIQGTDLSGFKDTSDKVNYDVLGGWSAIFMDLFTTGYDITDWSLDEVFLEESMLAYAESRELFQEAYGESGYCIDQLEQLLIVLGIPTTIEYN